MKNKSIPLVIVLLSSALILSGCGKTEQQPAQGGNTSMPVKEQTLGQSLRAERDFEYPGLVASQSEAAVSAKASGNLSGADFQVGDKVELGQELGRIDDVNSGGQVSSGNTNQIKQAKIVAEQAKSALDLAQSSYNNLLVSSAKDLRQAEISLEQAKNGQSNLDITSNDSLKSAQLGYDNAKIATAQAKSSLENRQKLAEQSEKDVKDNAAIAASSGASLAGSIITNINNVTGFDENNSVSVAYRSNLGALDSNSYNDAKTAYQAARDAYKKYLDEKSDNVSANLPQTISLLQAVKDAADKVKYMFDKSISSTLLPASSASGTSLSGLQQAASGYQSQINASVSQLQLANQALINAKLNNDSTIDNLQRVYELAKQQEEIAKQNLSNLQAGNVSQADQASFVVTLAQNQYDNLKVKLDSQVSASRTQLDNAQLQYNNALIALQSAYDNRVLVSPISGTVTKKNVNNGESVSAGQLVAVISQPDQVKIQFYVEQEAVSKIAAGLAVKIATNDGKERDGIVSAVSPQADPISRRFLVEANLVAPDSSLYLGTVVSVKVRIVDETKAGMGIAFLPISAVDISQSGQYVFIDEGGVAKKLAVSVEEVLGEWARIKIDALGDTKVIIDGNKRIQEGDSVFVSEN